MSEKITWLPKSPYCLKSSCGRFTIAKYGRVNCDYTLFERNEIVRARLASADEAKKLAEEMIDGVGLAY